MHGRCRCPCLDGVRAREYGYLGAWTGRSVACAWMPLCRRGLCPAHTTACASSVRSIFSSMRECALCVDPKLADSSWFPLDESALARPKQSHANASTNMQARVHAARGDTRIREGLRINKMLLLGLQHYKMCARLGADDRRIRVCTARPS